MRSKLGPALIFIFSLLLLSACRDEPAGSTPATTQPPATSPPAAATIEPVSTGTPATADDQPTAAEPTTATPRSLAGTVPAPEFPTDLEWFNVPEPLTLAQLKGKIVLFDFWTYGCINCLHVIPELKSLEEKYADELVVIGVHSAKFPNEAEGENIRRIIERYEIQHPVINDDEFILWRTYGIQAWPTFVLLDPDGKLVGFHSGEDIYELFDEVIGLLVAEFSAQGKLNPSPIELVLEQSVAAVAPLRFPGKVLVDEGGGRLFIADSNHNRIVMTDLDGNVLAVIGSGLAALQDGGYDEAAFFRPQGLALADADTLYVADTENHAIRRVDLTLERVVTVAGTGEQMFQRSTFGVATSTALNSPWDLAWHDGQLYIAMAGQHQIWRYDPAEEKLYRVVGSGHEALRDGVGPEAALNQPSGLALAGELLYVADSEASAIRQIDLANDAIVSTLVGVGLFEFGDVDGAGPDVRLQHPLGLAYQDGVLYIADTYNDKIKRLELASGTVTSWLGDGTAGWQDGSAARFDEPGGLSAASDALYIADTNNHVIRRADLATGEVTTLVLVDPAGLLTRQPEGVPYSGKLISLEPQTVAAGQGHISLTIQLPAGYKLNDLAPLSLSWSGPESIVGFEPDEATLSLVAPVGPLVVPASFSPGAGSLQADLVIYYCDEAAASLCLIEQVRLALPLTVNETGAAELAVHYEVFLPAGIAESQ